MAFFKKFRDAQRPCCAALVAAAGSSSRMGGVNKLLQPLDGIPVLARTLTALQMARRIDEIVVGRPGGGLSGDLPAVQDLRHHQMHQGDPGRGEPGPLGASGSTGSRGGHGAAGGAGRRPRLGDAGAHRRCGGAGRRCGAAAPAVAVKDTIKAVRDDGTVAETLDRAALRAVQTPQIFESALLKAALQAAVEGGIPITDDCSAVERLGKRVYLVEGDEENLKITTPVDLILAEAILQAREDRI